MKRMRFCRNVLAMSGLTGLLGCAIATDLVNPDLIQGLGLDQNVISPPLGTVIVVFQNATTSLATMCVAEVPSSDLSTLQTACHDVPAGETRNYVFDCPVTTIMPGIGDTGTDQTATTIAGTAAATVVTGTTAVVVDYDGSPLRSGLEFNCGDVIQITLIPSAATGTNTAAFAIQVQVLRG